MKTENEYPEKQFDAFFNERKPSYTFWEAENDEKTELFSADDLYDAYCAGFIEGKARDAKIREKIEKEISGSEKFYPDGVFDGGYRKGLRFALLLLEGSK